MAGDRIAHYEILHLLGKGGMGEVYRARDGKLGREVALKLLPEAFAADPERLARFQREARTLAALQHPNIAAIHGMDEADGRHFLTMELVEGEELSERLERGALSVEETQRVAIGIARGLEAAHEKGIVHRDLKPSNVMLTASGDVKILDFGLARAFVDENADPHELANSPTITAAMTQAGTILGTAAYMSPEQARGGTVDHRSDIWSFGVLLWEMLHGKRLFEGNTTSDTIASLLKNPLDFDAVPSGTPRAMRRVLARCLQRDPKQRLHAIADARIELESGDEAEFPVDEMSRGKGSARVPWVLASVFAALSLGLLWLNVRQKPEPGGTTQALSIVLPEDRELALNDFNALAISMNGQTLGLVTRGGGPTTISTRTLSDPAVQMESMASGANSVSVSPDGEWIAYFAEGKIWKKRLGSGSPSALAESAYPRGTTWADDGYIYYSPEYSAGIHRVHESGNREPEQLTEPDQALSERTHRWPTALPDGRGVVYTIGLASSPGEYEDASLAVYDARRGMAKRLGIQGAMARYAPGGRLIIGRRGMLYAVDFDLGSLTVSGDPVPVFENVREDASSGVYFFDIDASGNLYYVDDEHQRPERTLAWIDRDGTATRIDLPPGNYNGPRLNATSQQAILMLGEGLGSNDDVYLLSLRDLNLTRLTFDTVSIYPVWLHDAPKLMYLSVIDLLRVRDLGRSSQVAKVPGFRSVQMAPMPASAGSDGRTVLGVKFDEPTLGDIWVIDLQDSTRTRPIVKTAAAEWSPSFAPDQQWFAYASDESGREEVFVQPYPPTGAKWQVSFDGGRLPVWSPDGSEIFFMRGEGMYSAEVELDPAPRFRRPVLLFEHALFQGPYPMPNYTVTADGQRFLVVEADQTRGTRQLEVVLGWAGSLGQPD